MEGREEAPQFDLPHWIEELAAVAAAKGEALRAATLWGATDALFERFGLATARGEPSGACVVQRAWGDHSTASFGALGTRARHDAAAGRRVCARRGSGDSLIHVGLRRPPRRPTSISNQWRAPCTDDGGLGAEQLTT